MIIHKLVANYFKNKDDETFYAFQAQDALRWIEPSIKPLPGRNEALDLGCGHGVFGGEMLKRGWQVTFSDEAKSVLPEFERYPFVPINLDRDKLQGLPQFDLIICSNVLEHLARPQEFLSNVHHLLKPGGKLYLSWTNWLSPWGGHEFSPFHYLGASRGHRVFDKLLKKPRKHTPFENLYPTYIGTTVKHIKKIPNLRLLRMAPRYYTEAAFLMRIPVLREFLAWNTAMLIERVS